MYSLHDCIRIIMNLEIANITLLLLVVVVCLLLLFICIKCNVINVIMLSCKWRIQVLSWCLLTEKWRNSSGWSQRLLHPLPSAFHRVHLGLVPPKCTCARLCVCLRMCMRAPMSLSKWGFASIAPFSIPPMTVVLSAVIRLNSEQIELRYSASRAAVLDFLSPPGEPGASLPDQTASSGRTVKREKRYGARGGLRYVIW